MGTNNVICSGLQMSAKLDNSISKNIYSDCENEQLFFIYFSRQTLVFEKLGADYVDCSRLG
jgi:hypothetical protein